MTRAASAGRRSGPAARNPQQRVHLQLPAEHAQPGKGDDRQVEITSKVRQRSRSSDCSHSSLAWTLKKSNVSEPGAVAPAARSGSARQRERQAGEAGSHDCARPWFVGRSAPCQVRRRTPPGRTAPSRPCASATTSRRGREDKRAPGQGSVRPSRTHKASIRKAKAIDSEELRKPNWNGKA